MRVLLDDRPINDAAVSLADAIELGRERASEQGRIIIEVLGDGASVGPDLLDSPPDDTAGFAELKMVSADPGVFVSVTLSDAAGLLDDAAGAQKEAADAVMEGRRESAFEPLQRALMSWGVLRDVVEKSSILLGMGLESVTVEQGTAADAIASLAASLGELKRALVEQDDSALADTIAYDLAEQVERWRGVLKAMERAAAERGG